MGQLLTLAQTMLTSYHVVYMSDCLPPQFVYAWVNLYIDVL